MQTLSEMSNIGWSMLLGNQPIAPTMTPARKAAAVQVWEDKRGNGKNVPAPRARKAAPAKKRKPARTAKGKSRK